MDIDFILSHPQRPANVGAAARALKTMGFSQLVLVGSQLHEDREARWVAHGAGDILDAVRCVETLAELRGDYDLMIATTARERHGTRRFYTPPQLCEHLINRKVHTALVFGCEASGLSNAELQCCDLFSYIPMAQTYPSLNLGQAVMVYAYALSAIVSRLGPVPGHHGAESETGSAAETEGIHNREKNENGELQVLKQRVSTLLDQCPHQQNHALDLWLMEHLATLGDRDIRMAHQLVALLEAAQSSSN